MVTLEPRAYGGETLRTQSSATTSKSEAICRHPQTLIIYEPNNSDYEPKTPTHCLGPKVHRLNLELASI